MAPTLHSRVRIRTASPVATLALMIVASAPTGVLAPCIGVAQSTGSTVRVEVDSTGEAACVREWWSTTEFLQVLETEVAGTALRVPDLHLSFGGCEVVTVRSSEGADIARVELEDVADVARIRTLALATVDSLRGVTPPVGVALTPTPTAPVQRAAVRPPLAPPTDRATDLGATRTATGAFRLHASFDLVVVPVLAFGGGVRGLLPLTNDFFVGGVISSAGGIATDALGAVTFGWAAGGIAAEYVLPVPQWLPLGLRIQASVSAGYQQSSGIARTNTVVRQSAEAFVVMPSIRVEGAWHFTPTFALTLATGLCFAANGLRATSRDDLGTRDTVRIDAFLWTVALGAELAI